VQMCLSLGLVLFAQASIAPLPTCDALPAWTRMGPCKSGDFAYIAYDSGAISGDPVLGINTNVLMVYSGLKLGALAAQGAPDLKAEIELRSIELVNAAQCDRLQFALVRSESPALKALSLPKCAADVGFAKPSKGCPKWAYIHVTQAGDRVEAVAAVPDSAGKDKQAARAAFLLHAMVRFGARTKVSVQLPEDRSLWRWPSGQQQASAQLADEKDEHVHCDGQLWVKRTARVLP
jgi:hypothetical protein